MLSICTENQFSLIPSTNKLLTNQLVCLFCVACHAYFEIVKPSICIGKVIIPRCCGICSIEPCGFNQEPEFEKTAPTFCLYFYLYMR